MTTRPARFATSVLLALAVAGSQAAPVLATAGCLKTTELAMESRVMCQVCGVPLAVASSLEANRERVFIQRLVNRCESITQIESALVAQYGPSVLATPSTRGFAVSAYVVPAIAILGAAMAITAVIVSARGGRRRREEQPGVIPPPTSSEDARLDAALSAHRQR
jgi:cytochrome c-type biogenesis protein CcmH/NrfF